MKLFALTKKGQETVKEILKAGYTGKMWQTEEGLFVYHTPVTEDVMREYAAPIVQVEDGKKIFLFEEDQVGAAILKAGYTGDLHKMVGIYVTPCTMAAMETMRFPIRKTEDGKEVFCIQ